MTPEKTPMPDLQWIESDDGHRWQARIWRPAQPRWGLFWVPALGVAAEKYDRVAQSLGSHGIVTAIHEWRGTGSSSQRAGRRSDWGYRELLGQDLATGWSHARAIACELPWVAGGHSLGAQLAFIAVALSEVPPRGLLAVASGIPHHAVFPASFARMIRVFARSLPALTRIVGHFPGSALKFAGREAGGVMRDWARTALTGRYHDPGLGVAPEARMRALDVPAFGLCFEKDTLAPTSSMQALLDKLGSAERRLERMSSSELGAHADHFRWLRQPDPVTARIADWGQFLKS